MECIPEGVREMSFQIKYFSFHYKLTVKPKT